MASPRPANSTAGISATSTQPITPPAEDPSTSNAPPPPANPAATTTSSNPDSTPAAANPSQVPATSLQDAGKSRRPRDARLIHMLLASLGVSAYQERVPLQLLDFAYRYTSSTLQDAVYLATEGYPGETLNFKGEGGAGGKSQQSQDASSVSLGALRMSIASRLHYQFQPGLPKEFLMDIAAERNRIMLPGVSRGHEGGTAAGGSASDPAVMMGGMRLPPERFCLTGVGWDLKEEWESEGEEEMEVDGAEQGQCSGDGEKEEDGVDEDDDADGKMEDVFGDEHMNEGERDEDKTMTDV